MNQGTVVIDGNIYDITHISLRAGTLLITAFGIATNHVAASPDAPATVYGQDGQGICQGWKTPMPALTPGLPVTIVLPIRIDSLVDVP